MLGAHVLVVGGTQGIGTATARLLASRGASVTILGRNAARGAETVAALEKSAPQLAEPRPAFAFHAIDVTSIANVKRLCADLRKHLNENKSVSAGLSGLVLCAGGLGYGPRRETAEGVELIFAQNYLSRFVFIQELLPLLSASHGRVINCLGAGTGGAINTADWQTQNGFSFLKANSQVASMTDVLTKELARRFGSSQHVQFFHFFPGAVNTKSAENQGFPWWITLPASFVMPLIAAPPERTAETICYLLASDEYGKPEFNGRLVGPSLEERKFIQPLANGGEKLASEVWNYTNNLASQF